jgi:hypothetical protein
LNVRGVVGAVAPLPKPADQRRRRNAPIANTLKLPAEGRVGPTPEWPLLLPPADQHLSVWREIWKTPMAVGWERLGWERAVAAYVLVTVEAEAMRSADVKIWISLLAEARQHEDRLGLTPMALLRLRWEISTDELAVRRPVVERPRRRLEAVDDAVARAE